MNISVRLKTPRCWNCNQLYKRLKGHINAIYYDDCDQIIDPRTEVLITNNITDAQIYALPNLVSVICPTSGHEGIPYQALHEKGIILFTNIDNIAECVSAYVEHHVMSFIHKHDDRNLEGKRIMILGFGAVGARVFKRLSIYGGNYTIVRKNLDKIQLPSLCKEIRLPDVRFSLSHSDIIINALPLNEETTEALATDIHFQPSAVFVGLSRAGIFNEIEIANKIFKKMLSAAILDVYPPELDMFQGQNPQLILTKHTAGIWGKGISHLIDYVLEKIEFLNNRFGHVN